MLSGYHRGAAVLDSHFSWTGGTAIAAWGRTDELSENGIHGWDATPGDIPQVFSLCQAIYLSIYLSIYPSSFSSFHGRSSCL